MAGDTASPVTHYGTHGMKFINANFILTLSRLPDGPFIALAALLYSSHAGVATGTVTMIDEWGPVGSSVTTALADPRFEHSRSST
ncbi:hypothetical protein HQO44_16780 [Rhodococcus fascians]|nr:hypothetical protein [Rhodococcus fascians]